ncbi:MAG: hypothetical protein NTW19_12730 [Planctomycetota bacterium]|nr:hypothetical protein [Planctomycetota bacterium]
MTTSKAVAMLLLVLSNQGYWFGGRENTIDVQWTLESGVPPAVLNWQLAIDQMPLPNGSGKVALPEGRKASRVTIKLPEVRVRTPMRWLFKVTSPDGTKEYASGEQAIEVFPHDLLAALRKRVSGKLVMVWDKPGGLPAAFEAAEVGHRLIERAEQFTMTRPDVILVGAEALDGEPTGQAALLGLAEAGTSVMIFRQTKVERLMTYPLIERKFGKGMPPLQPPRMAGLRPSARRSWTTGFHTRSCRISRSATGRSLRGTSPSP